MRYDVGKLSHHDSPSGCYLETVLERFSKSWSVNGTLAEKWQVVKNALTSAADNVLDFSSRHQPDWFADSLELLQSLLTSRNAAYSKWICTSNPENLIVFKRARGEAKWAVREANNRWFQEKEAAYEESQLVVSWYGIVYEKCSLRKEVGYHP